MITSAMAMRIQTSMDGAGKRKTRRNQSQHEMRSLAFASLNGENSGGVGLIIKIIIGKM